MSSDPHQKRVADAVSNIRNFHKKSGPSSAKGTWQLNIPVWQVALEGMIAFIIAFICGLGGGVLLQVAINA